MLMRKRSSMAMSSGNNTNPSHLTTPRFLLGLSAKSSSDTDPTASTSPSHLTSPRFFLGLSAKSSSDTDPIASTSPCHLTSPRFLLGLSAKPSSSTAPAASPTSILESRPFSSPFANPFNPRPSWHNTDSPAVGLGIVESLRNERPEVHRKSGSQESRMLHFGSQLKVQVPSMQPNSNSTAGWEESPCSPIEFGVKNKSSQLALLSRALRSPMACSARVPPLPSSDMEMSEDYTCVIAHGPNPRTTHIFDNCIVENCGGSSYAPSPREKRFLACHSDDLSAFCHACKKSLGSEKDILTFRGEKSFCSSECEQEMIFGEGMEKASSGSFVAGAPHNKRGTSGQNMVEGSLNLLVIVKNVSNGLSRVATAMRLPFP